MSRRRFVLHVAKNGNHFMLAIAEMLKYSIQYHGLECEIKLDNHPKKGFINIIIAPHEFFPLFANEQFIQWKLKSMRCQLFMINVEQPGSIWFERAISYFKLADKVYDISTIGCKAIQEKGIECHFLPLGFSEILKSKANHEKDIDMIFLGHSSPKRELFFVQHSRELSEFNNLLLFNDLNKPRKPGDSGFYNDEIIHGLIQRSKVLINIHSYDRNYFEWHRILKAIVNKTVVVSEFSTDTLPLEHNKSFFNLGLNDIIPKVKELLKNEKMRISVSEEAYELLQNKRNMHDIVNTFLENC